MGANGSKLEKALAECPDDERYYGAVGGRGGRFLDAREARITRIL